MLKLAFITGATSGIGSHLALTLKKRKYEVINFSRSKASEYKNYHLDLSDPKAYEFLAEKTLELKPKLIILNSGIGSFDFIKNLDPKKLNNILEINALNYVKYLTSIWGYLLENKIKILYLSSTVSYSSGAGQSYYSLGKKMISDFCSSLATELKFYNSSSTITEFVMHFTNLTNLHKNVKKDGNLSELINICENAINAIENSEEKYVPKYNEIYKKVFDAYYENKVAQGIASLEYRLKMGRITK